MTPQTSTQTLTSTEFSSPSLTVLQTNQNITIEQNLHLRLHLNISRTINIRSHYKITSTLHFSITVYFTFTLVCNYDNTGFIRLYLSFLHVTNSNSYICVRYCHNPCITRCNIISNASINLNSSHIYKWYVTSYGKIFWCFSVSQGCKFSSHIKGPSKPWSSKKNL